MTRRAARKAKAVCAPRLAAVTAEDASAAAAEMTPEEWRGTTPNSNREDYETNLRTAMQLNDLVDSSKTDGTFVPHRSIRALF